MGDPVRHGDHIAGTPECWDKCGEIAVQDADDEPMAKSTPYGEHPDVASGFICGSCGYPGEWLQEELVRVSEQLRLATIDQAIAEADANDARLFLAIERTQTRGADDGR